MKTTNGLSRVQRDRANKLLDEHPLFAGLRVADKEELLKGMTLFVLEGGEVLFRQRDPADQVFVLASGRIALARRSDGHEEKVLSLVRPGESFAEAVLFSNHRLFPVTATALESSVIWGVEAERYRAVLATSSDACFAILARLSERLHRQVAEIERLTLHTATERLIGYLLERAEPRDDRFASITLDVPKKVIASHLSIVPATFSRVLARLVSERLVEVHEDRIDILDVSALRALVRDLLV